jgi:hypothetical protein
MPLNDLTGKTFGRLTVIRVGMRKAGKVYWLCNCECGKTKNISSINLTKGRASSCGCFRTVLLTEATTKHGHTANWKRSSEYMAWCSMKYRCNNPNNKRYADYGGRGIKVCDRWMDSFENFLSDMGTKPSKAHSLDRINNNGDYTPFNCRWATAVEQNRNKRVDRRILAAFDYCI